MRQTSWMACIAATALLAGAAGVAWSQSREQGRRMGDQAREPGCQQMLAELQRLGGELVELDRALHGKSEQMQRASEGERLGAMEAVIEEMVGQRRLVLNRIKVSHQMLVHHLLSHLTVDPPEDGRAALRACVLMEYMKQAAPPSGSGSAPAGPLDR